MKLLEFTDRGICCPQGGFYIDPWRPVDRALITHAHSDHARRGSRYYLSHHHTAPVLKLRLGDDINLETIGYNEAVIHNGVKISFHPAGHIIGSAQIRLEYKGYVWVVSGDYKTEYDGISEAFEPVKCNAFISESTFGMPVYKWKPQAEVVREINNWWQGNRSEGITSILTGYPLGKAQRLLCNVDHSIGPVFTHGSVDTVNQVLKGKGVCLPDVKKITPELHKSDYTGALIIAPPSAAASPWMRKFYPYSMANCSGWMSLRGAKRRNAVDRGFVLSDHADWPGLNAAIRETGASKIYITHGYTASFTRWLCENGMEAYEVHTLFQGESPDVKAAEEEMFDKEIDTAL